MSETSWDADSDATAPVDPSAKGGDPLLGKTLGGRFLLRALLGRGGMGRVYLAEDQRLKRRVALKLMDAALSGDGEFARRFRREALVQAQAAHPGIVQVLDAGESPDGAFIVLEYSEGRPLSELMKLGPMRRERALDLVRQMLEVLDFAHRQGIVHRDLKPGNVLVEDRGGREVVRVLDFGIAKLRPSGGGATEEGPTLTRTGFGFGTPGYMSLEQATGRPTDHRTDLYAIGVILYRLLGGGLPFAADSVSDYLVKLATTAPKPLGEAYPDAGVPPELDAIVLRALAREPADRTPSALHFLNEIREFQRTEDAPTARTEPGRGGAARRAVPAVAPKPAAPGRGALFGMAAFAALAAAAAAFGFLRARDAERAARTADERATYAVAAERALDDARAALKSAGAEPDEATADVAASIAAWSARERARVGTAESARDAAAAGRDAEKSRADRLAGALAAAESKARGADEVAAGLRAEAEALRGALRASDSRSAGDDAGLRSDLVASRSEREGLRAELAKREEALRDAKEEIATLRGDLRRLEGELAARHARPAAERDLAETERADFRAQIESLRREIAAERARPAGGGTVRFPLRVENATSVAVDLLGLTAIVGAAGSERSLQLALPSVTRLLSGKTTDLAVDLDAPLLRIEARVSKFVRAGSATPGPPETLRRNDLAFKDGALVLTIK